MKFEQEPPADMRTAALGVHALFVSLVEAGFSETQALQLVAEFLRETVSSMKKDT